jgi:hypothetical protein
MLLFFISYVGNSAIERRKMSNRSYRSTFKGHPLEQRYQESWCPVDISGESRLLPPRPFGGRPLRQLPHVSWAPITSCGLHYEATILQSLEFLPIRSVTYGGHGPLATIPCVEGGAAGPTLHGRNRVICEFAKTSPDEPGSNLGSFECRIASQSTFRGPRREWARGEATGEGRTPVISEYLRRIAGPGRG